MKISYVFLALFLLVVLVSPVSADATLQWTKTIGYCVTAVDTNAAGSLIYAGLGNGTIFVYDATGNITWTNSTNTTSANRAIKKIVADTNGNIVWINQANQSGYIAYTGVIGGMTSGTGRNVTDVGMSDSRYATSELNPPRLVIHYQNGTTETQNTTFGTTTYWNKIGYDPNGAWLVTANTSSNILYFWNFTTYTGWDEFNPLHNAIKSPNQTFLDAFPYRQNVSIEGTLGKELIFVNTTNTTYLQRLNNSHYEYNALNTGPYFYWTRSGYENESQTSLLGLSWISGSTYYVALKPGYTNYTVYYGLPSYTNSVNNASFYYGNQTYTVAGTGSFNIPLNVTGMKYFVVGGGGGGGSRGLGAGGNGSNVTGTLSVVPGGAAFTYVVGSGGASDTNGTNSSITNSTTTLTGLYGLTYRMPWAAAGQNGTNTLQLVIAPNSPQGGTGGTVYGWDGEGCQTLDVRAGTVGGHGYGAGGGQGGYQDPAGCICGCPPGGAGVSGLVNITFSSFTSPTYAASTLYSQQNRYSITAINQTGLKYYVGNIYGLSVPSNGGIVSIITDTIFYQQYVSNTGFGLTYCATLSSGGAALFAGTPFTVSASNSGAASIEGRGSYGNIYDSGGVARASSLTGNNIRAADSAMSSGTLAAFGGDEGKLYILSREGSSSWYSYYTGTADTRIDAVSLAWDGSSVSVGRFGGTLEYYLTNVTATVNGTSQLPSEVEASVYVYKDGAPYPLQPVTIFSSNTSPSNWLPDGSSYTDGQGHMRYPTVTGTYYKFVVNSDEGNATWQSNSATPTVQIFIKTPATPYEWNAYYDEATHNVTVVYSDMETPTSVNVTIKDLKTNTIVMSELYYSDHWTTSYHDVLENGSYQVNVRIDRLGTVVRDQRVTSAGNTYEIPLPMDTTIKHALAMFVLMLIAGMFGYANSRKGALAVVIIAVVMMVFGFLPWSMITAAMLAGIFAVMSLFSTRGG